MTLFPDYLLGLFWQKALFSLLSCCNFFWSQETPPVSNAQMFWPTVAWWRIRDAKSRLPKLLLPGKITKEKKNVFPFFGSMLASPQLYFLRPSFFEEDEPMLTFLFKGVASNTTKIFVKLFPKRPKSRHSLLAGMACF